MIWCLWEYSYSSDETVNMNVYEVGPLLDAFDANRNAPLLTAVTA